MVPLCHFARRCDSEQKGFNFEDLEMDFDASTLRVALAVAMTTIARIATPPLRPNPIPYLGLPSKHTCSSLGRVDLELQLGMLLMMEAILEVRSRPIGLPVLPSRGISLGRGSLPSSHLLFSTCMYSVDCTFNSTLTYHEGRRTHWDRGSTKLSWKTFLGNVCSVARYQGSPLP